LSVFSIGFCEKTIKSQTLSEGQPKNASSLLGHAVADSAEGGG